MATEFIVSDMTCNHCVKTITNAIHEIEPKAEVSIDLATHRVAINRQKIPKLLRMLYVKRAIPFKSVN